MPVKVHLPRSLAPMASEEAITIEAHDVRAALEALEARLPGLKSRVCEPSGNVRRFISITANSEDIRFLDNLSTRLPEGATLAISPAVAGGWYR